MEMIIAKDTLGKPFYVNKEDYSSLHYDQASQCWILQTKYCKLPVQDHVAVLEQVGIKPIEE